MSVILNIPVAQRRDTAAAWTQVNPILPAGQLGFETDTRQFKMGDGSTRWRDLPYAGGFTVRTAATESEFNSMSPGPGEAIVLYE